ncbi:MAG: hypothetical protein ABFE07_16105 [Armatimonadia bacterium]
MDILRTFTATPAQVEAARAAAESIPGGSGMFVAQDEQGNYVSSGYVSQELADALEGLCAIS